MQQSYRFSFYIILALVFLAPLFFIPGGAMALGSAKSTLLVLGTVVLSLVFIFESWRQGGFSFPKHNFFYAALLLPVVYLISAALTTPSSLSLLGYNIEVGTFGFALLGTLALLVAATVTIETNRYLQVLVALFASFSLLALFATIKILSGGDFLVLGNFGGNMGNPLGGWTDLSMAFGLLAAFAALIIGMVPMKASVKSALYAIFVLSTVLLVIIGFSTAFVLTLAASLFLWLYFAKVEKDFYFSNGEVKGGFLARPVFLPILLAVISLVMFINPQLSDTQTLSGAISGKFGVSNADVRPSLSATLGISKAVLSQAGLLGSGPNTFSQDWLIFKPLTVNATPFWGVAFPFGVGFIPTQIATTGILGTALWLVFLVLLIVLSLKVLNKVPESRASRFTLVSTLFITLFLWAGALFYVPSAAMFFLAFIFTGFLLALSRDNGILSTYMVDLKESAHVRPIAFTLMILGAVGVIYFGSLGAEKALAAYHYQKAIKLSNTEGALISDVENELIKAAQLDGVDAYFTAISQLNFSKAQAAANAATGTPEQNRAIFEDGLRRSIEAARAAVSANPAAYANWVALGSIYASLVPEPLKVEGSYENAQYAYSEALKRNPNNPELPLFLARLELAKGNVENARSYILNSIALKEDYADAYLLLAQLEVQEKNIPAAIQSTEALAVLAPTNAGVHFELGVLKYSNKDYNGALTSLKEAVRLVPDYANAKYYLALTYKELGMVDDARNELEDLLVANPDSEEVKTLLDSLTKPASLR
jgi:tetratricopeptide (TPR) repeat protein